MKTKSQQQIITEKPELKNVSALQYGAIKRAMNEWANQCIRIEIQEEERSSKAKPYNQ